MIVYHCVSCHAVKYPGDDICVHLQTVTLLESLEEEGDIILDAHLSLARFADGQYQHIVNYMKSSTFEAKQNLMLKAKREMMRMQQLGKEELDKE